MEIQKKKTTRFLYIPDDCLFEIFTFILYDQTMINISVSCKRFYTLWEKRVKPFKISQIKNIDMLIYEQEQEQVTCQHKKYTDICSGGKLVEFACQSREPKLISYCITGGDMRKCCKICKSYFCCDSCFDVDKSQIKKNQCYHCKEDFCFDYWDDSYESCGYKCCYEDCNYRICKDCSKIKSRCKKSTIKHINCSFCPIHGCGGCLLHKTKKISKKKV